MLTASDVLGFNTLFFVSHCITFTVNCDTAGMHLCVPATHTMTHVHVNDVCNTDSMTEHDCECVLNADTLHFY